MDEHKVDPVGHTFRTLFICIALLIGFSIAMTHAKGACAQTVSTEQAAQSNAGAGAVANINTTNNQPGAVSYSGTQTLKTVPTVAPPGLTTTLTETCMGSTSGGGSVAGFGLTIGATWRDSECVRRLNARELNAMGMRDAAVELMCDNPDVQAAMARTGLKCGSPHTAQSPAQRTVYVGRP